MASKAIGAMDYPEYITLPDKSRPGRELRLEKQVDANGVVYYSAKLDWRAIDLEDE